MVVRRGERARIGVVDDHPSIVAGLRAILGDQPDLEFTAGAATVSKLLTETRDLDLVVLDLRLEDGSSPQINVDRLAELDIPAVAYTSGDEPYLVRLAASAGVKAVLRKNVDDDVLLAAIRAVLSGEETPTVDWAAAIDADDDVLRAGGPIDVDLNRATNLPCAFIDFATCPLPPAGNHLPFEVRAGEQTPYGRG